ncbi:hypothetical protein MA16_Dca002221 [Dendrobium catenatum]|uniref:Uncharacterized protein n=1 Tax=Dendrobium catenatum TaxID=906689 RepID=A0A2I0VZW1_9ASPA|nr:hypothetical protein MA16_Dca002221 [Dendrobium catenatum]
MFGDGVAAWRLLEMREGRVREKAAGKGKVVELVAEVARGCLMVSGEERPTQREVAEELRNFAT